jgi:hypothetical protein
MTEVMSKTATSDMIRVIVGQEFSFKENMTGETNGVNPDRSTAAASAGCYRPSAVGSSW